MADQHEPCLGLGQGSVPSRASFQAAATPTSAVRATGRRRLWCEDQGFPCTTGTGRCKHCLPRISGHRLHGALGGSGLRPAQSWAGGAWIGRTEGLVDWRGKSGEAAPCPGAMAGGTQDLGPPQSPCPTSRSWVDPGQWQSPPSRHPALDVQPQPGWVVEGSEPSAQWQPRLPHTQIRRAGALWASAGVRAAARGAWTSHLGSDPPTT